MHPYPGELLRAALRLAADDYNDAEDPGWQQELDLEIFDKAAKDYVDALMLSRSGISTEETGNA